MSTQPLWVFALVALGGGLVGGGLVYTLGLSTDPGTEQDAEAARGIDRAASGSTKKAETEKASDADVRGRLEELDERLRSLQRSMTARENLKRYAKALGEQDDADSPAEAQERRPEPDANNPAFELAVRTVYDRIEWEKNEEQQAERKLRGRQRAEHQTEMLSEDLSLRPAQTDRVRSILAEQMAAFAELRNPNNQEQRPQGRDEWRQRLRQMRTNTDGKMEEVLDAEQLEKYRQLMQQRRQDRREGGRQIWRGD